MNKLNDIPDGIPLVDIMVSLHEEHIDKDDNISHSSALEHSEDANMEIDEEELEEVLESDSEEEAKKIKSVAEIDGYDMDELADWVESDTEFNPRGEVEKPKVTPKEVIKEREETLKNLSVRNKIRENEKRDKLKKDFTDNMSKKDWNKFKSWYNEQNPDK